MNAWGIMRGYFVCGSVITLLALLILSYHGVTTGILDIKEFIGATITFSACVAGYWLGRLATTTTKRQPQ